MITTLALVVWMTIYPLVGLAPLTITTLIRVPVQGWGVDHFCHGWEFQGEVEDPRYDTHPAARYTCRWSWRGLEQFTWKLEREGQYRVWADQRLPNGRVVKVIERLVNVS